MFYMRIQKTAGPDLEFHKNTVGELIKIVIVYVQNNPKEYRGHFILKKDFSPIL